jgi:4-amino-4-deoxy-L-arabinose transferase-like glycosyltransferase
MSASAPEATLPPPARSEWLGIAALTLLASVLLLTNLGNHYLWQDEAQTALIAGTVLETGLPRGRDGVNSFSQEFGVEYGENGIWKWHTWLSFYLCAASLGLLGPTTLAARLPFALFAIATVVLSYFTSRSLWRDRRAAAFSATLLTLCVPFLILSRQCRYYSVAAFFTLTALLAYTRLRPGERVWAGTLFVAGTLLFHTHYVYCATLLATLLAHSLFLDRRRFAPVLAVSAGVTLFNAPWIHWFSSIRYGENYAGRMLDLGLTAEIGLRLVTQLVDYFFHPVFVAIAIGFAVVHAVRREPILAVRMRKPVWLVVLFCGVNISFLAIAAPSGYFRYLMPLAAPLFLLVGALMSALSRRSKLLTGVALAIWLALGSLHLFVYELTHDFDGPIEGIVKTLQAFGEPGQVVAVNYGDLPIKFYTGMRVVGGLTGEDLEAARDADWIILRKDNVGAEEDLRIRRFLAARLQSGGYEGIEIEYPDTPFENREDPGLHRFRTQQGVKKVRLYRRRR